MYRSLLYFRKKNVEITIITIRRIVIMIGQRYGIEIGLNSVSLVDVVWF